MELILDGAQFGNGNVIQHLIAIAELCAIKNQFHPSTSPYSRVKLP